MSPFLRKLRKLRRDPKLYFRDMIAKRMDSVGLPSVAFKGVTPFKQKRGRFNYVVVSAVYNVAPYLDTYFRSLVNQSLDFRRNIKLVLVDDGSPDKSASIIRKWAAKYPDNIFYVAKDNGGQASARNVGIDYVESNLVDASYITFIDPDDFVELGYFQTVDSFMARNSAHHFKMISCNFVFYDEKTGRLRDNHPLRYRFDKGDRIVELHNLDRDIQLSCNSAFFDMGVICGNSLRFREDIRPTFEDAHFSVRFMALAGHSAGAFLKSARYLYRKREDGSSTLDLSTKNKGLYLDVLKNGCLDLVDFFEGRGEPLPVHVQRTLLYHACNYFYWNSLVNHPERASLLSDEEKALFISYLDRVIKKIDADVINNFEITGLWFYHKSGIANCFLEERLIHQIAYVTGFDAAKNEIQLTYFSGEIGFEYFSIDGKEVIPTHAKISRHDFLDRTFILQRVLWLPIGLASEHSTLQIQIGDPQTECLISFLRRHHRTHLPLRNVLDHYAVGTTSDDSIEHPRKLWLFMDRENHADDNAEHLYAYVKASSSSHDVRFVLQRDSHDWDRLSARGFDLLAYGSAEHERALRLCDMIVSSHVDRHVVDYFRDGSLAHKKFVFLQHGVILHDLSEWFNTKDINCLVTSAPREYSSIVEHGTRYRLSNKEVVLTGLPRHDALLKRQKEVPTEKLILIMPTWRKWLAGKSIDGNQRAFNAQFMESEYAIKWQSLLNSERLKTLIDDHDYRVAFFPHSAIQPYLQMFEIPSYIDVLEHKNTQIQDLFCKSSLMITDYSSVSFEMGYLNKPVIYYQFDRESAGSGAHVFQEGYYDYEEDGFGPVCLREQSVLGALHQLLENGGEPDQKYLDRMETFFAFRDGKCCERVYQAILALDEPGINPDLHTMTAYAEAAETAERWDLAETRWREILKTIGSDAGNTELRHLAQRQFAQSLAEQGDQLPADLWAGLLQMGLTADDAVSPAKAATTKI